ncbi:MAG: ABC transporter substrate-binding protein [Candidatus Deferrimicrobiaceae bacterium]
MSSASGPRGGSGLPIGGGAVRRARAVPGLVFLILALLLAPARGEEPPPFLGSLSDTVPVERPAGTTVEKGGTPGGIVPLALLRNAETEFRSGDPAKALSLFLDLAYNFSDDERKGFVWMRVADLLLARQEFRQALDAADKAVLLSRTRFLALSAMDRKFRIYRELRWDTEARQAAAYLLDQGYIGADPSELLSAMARADAREGKISLALSEYTRVISSAADPGVARRLADERNALIDGMADIPALWDAAQSEENSEIRAHLYLHLGRLAVRRGFSGMGAFALERASRSGGESGEEAVRQMSRLEKFLESRPKIAGLVPLSGKYADLGFAVLCGAEVAVRRSRGQEAEPLSPVLRWMDSEGQPGRARVLFQMASVERSLIGFIGPLTGEEGHSVSAVFDPKSPPVLYLGQKTIPEKPFLYSFGLTPRQEARAVLSHLARKGRHDLILFHPDNGYGRGFADAVVAAAGETGVRVPRTVSYSPETSDFTGVIRKAVGNAAFSRFSSEKEKGAAMKLPQDAILIADRWEKVFLLASQLRFYNIYLPLAGFSGWNNEELARKAGDAVNGSVFSVDYAGGGAGSPGEMFRKEYEEVLGRRPSRFEAMGYDAALLLAESSRLEAAGDSRPAEEETRQKIVRLRTFRGVTGTFQFGPAGEVHRKVSLLAVELGNFIPVPEP